MQRQRVDHPKTAPAHTKAAASQRWTPHSLPHGLPGAGVGVPGEESLDAHSPSSEMPHSREAWASLGHCQSPAKALPEVQD